MPTFEGIEYNDIEGLPEFIRRHWKELKRLGIRRVFAHSTDDDEFNPNTLYIFSLPRNCGEPCGRIRKTPRVVRVVRPNWGAAADEHCLPRDWAHIFDIILHYGDDCGGYRVFIAYSSALNTFVTCDFTHDYQKWRSKAMLRYMRIVKNIVEGHVSFKYPIDPYAGLYDLMLNWPVRYATIMPINTAVCAANNVTLEINRDIRISFERGGENDRITIRGVQYKLPTRFKYRFKVTIVYDNDGYMREVRGEGEVVIDGKKFVHPNINHDNGSVCLGSLELPRIQQDTELCGQAARIAKMVTDVLSTPEVADAYSRDLYEYIERQYKGKMVETPW